MFVSLFSSIKRKKRKTFDLSGIITNRGEYVSLNIQYDAFRTRLITTKTYRKDSYYATQSIEDSVYYFGLSLKRYKPSVNLHSYLFKYTSVGIGLFLMTLKDRLFDIQINLEKRDRHMLWYYKIEDVDDIFDIIINSSYDTLKGFLFTDGYSDGIYLESSSIARGVDTIEYKPKSNDFLNKSIIDVLQSKLTSKKDYSHDHMINDSLFKIIKKHIRTKYKNLDFRFRSILLRYIDEKNVESYQFYRIYNTSLILRTFINRKTFIIYISQFMTPLVGEDGVVLLYIIGQLNNTEMELSVLLFYKYRQREKRDTEYERLIYRDIITLPKDLEQKIQETLLNKTNNHMYKFRVID